MLEEMIDLRIDFSSCRDVPRGRVTAAKAREGHNCKI